MSSTIAGQVMTQRKEWSAQWIWSGHAYHPWNRYVALRKAIDLPATPSRAVVRVSADALYTLYVNGTRVHHGPARCFPGQQSYDTLDLTPLLQPGPNVIAAVAYQFGTTTFQRTYRGASGFLLDGVVELEGDAPAVPLHTPTGWTVRPFKGWRQMTARLSMQLGFQEHFDADADPTDWQLPTSTADEADGWLPAHVVGPVGHNPWLLMEPRGVPLLADHVESFVGVLGQFRGENPRGYKVAEDVYHLVDPAECKKDDDAVPTAAAMLADDDAATEVPPPPEGEFVAVTLDLSTYRTGHLIIDVADAAGDEFIDVLFCEQLEPRSAMPMLLPIDDNSRESRSLRYRCRPGKQRWESFFYYGMRYALVVFRNVESSPLKVRRLAVRQVHAAFPDDEREGAGSFTCSDERLNQIWTVGVNTQLNCAFDAFVDCPGREQAMWWGDSRVQARVTAFAFGDATLLERGIRLVAQSQTATGTLHAHPPADVPRHQLPDFMMTWVGTLRDHWQLTGRTDLVTECLPTMHRLFEFLSSHDSPDGLVGGFDGFWMFLDWVPIFKGDHSAPFNLLYLQSLRWAAELCRLCRDGAAAGYDERAARVQSAVERAFWDEKLKCWRDGFDAAAGKPVEQVSQHTNALAILLGIKPETHAEIAREVLLKSARSKRTKTITASPFFYTYVLEALERQGLAAEVIGLVRDKWGEAFIDDGATTFYEMWTVTIESRCHAWSASPVYHLMQTALGVTPTAPGWGSVRIAPVPETLEFARGVVPTPHGPLRVEWEKGGEDQLVVRIEVPEGLSAEFVSPDGQRQQLDAGTNEFHT
jgi:alpha-L-rhamnosidase